MHFDKLDKGRFSKTSKHKICSNCFPTFLTNSSPLYLPASLLCRMEELAYGDPVCWSFPLGLSNQCVPLMVDALLANVSDRSHARGPPPPPVPPAVCSTRGPGRGRVPGREREREVLGKEQTECRREERQERNAHNQKQPVRWSTATGSFSNPSVGSVLYLYLIPGPVLRWSTPPAPVAQREGEREREGGASLRESEREREWCRASRALSPSLVPPPVDRIARLP